MRLWDCCDCGDVSGSGTVFHWLWARIHMRKCLCSRYLQKLRTVWDWLRTFDNWLTLNCFGDSSNSTQPPHSTGSLINNRFGGPHQWRVELYKSSHFMFDSNMLELILLLLSVLTVLNLHNRYSNECQRTHLYVCVDGWGIRIFRTYVSKGNDETFGIISQYFNVSCDAEWDGTRLGCKCRAIVCIEIYNEHTVPITYSDYYFDY